MKKLINFKDLEKSIRAYADEHCEGNFSLAVRMLAKKGLGKSRAYDTDTHGHMGVDSGNSEYSDAHLQDDLLK